MVECSEAGMLAGAIERILLGESGGVKLIEKLKGGERVRAQEIDEMSGAADGGGLLGGDTTESEVVELEGEKRRIAGTHESFANDLLDGARKSGDGDGIPDLDENRFGPVGEPVEFGVGVFDGDERVVGFYDGAFLDGADAERQAAAMLGVERFETIVVERLGMTGEMGVGDA